MLVREILPLALPLDPGANFTVKVAFCPAAIVSGVVSPLRLKPVPVTLAAEIVTLDVPELVRVMVCDPLLPTVTLPKVTLEGAAASCPWMPVPVREIVAGEFGALLAMEMLPVAPPLEVGVKVALNVAV